MATILKASGEQSRHDTPRTVAFNFGDVTAKAEQYLAEVRREAAKIIADAQTQAQQVLEQAKRQGQSDALAAAEQSMQRKVEQQLQFLVPAIQEAVLEVNREKVAWLKRWETDALRVATAIAEKVIRRELQQDPQITVAYVREALELASGLGSLTVRLNPADHKALAGQMSNIVDEMRKLTPTEVTADPSISPGGCRVDTDYGVVDQQIETQLERILTELTPE